MALILSILPLMILAALIIYSAINVNYDEFLESEEKFRK